MTRKTHSAAALSRPPVGEQQDSARAQAFIQGAVRREEHAQSQPEGYDYPWQDPMLRQDVTKVFNVRLPEPMKAKLQWLSQQGPRSMHQIVLEAAEEAIERQVMEHLYREHQR